MEATLESFEELMEQVPVEDAHNVTDDKAMEIDEETISEPVTDDKAVEIDEETISEGDEGDAVDESPTALDEAIQKVIAEKDSLISAQQIRIAQSELAARRPEPLRLENLSEEMQEMVLREAEFHGVEPQTILYSHYRQELDKYNAAVANLQASIEAQKSEASRVVAEFVLRNEHVAKLPPDKRKEFVDSIGQLEAVEAIDELYHVSPGKWAKAAIAIASREIAGLAAASQASTATKKATQSMKASVAASKPAATKVQTTPDPYADLNLSANSWDKRLRLK